MSDEGIVWQPRNRRHLHPMPIPSAYDYGSVARCSTCQLLFVREASGYLTYPPSGGFWRQIGWFAISWRWLLGRIPGQRMPLSGQDKLLHEPPPLAEPGQVQKMLDSETEEVESNWPSGLFWITADSDNLWSCGICGALVWMDGEGVGIHRKWHENTPSTR